MWKCSHAEGNNSEINQQILPEDISIEKTKWKSILTVEPKAFFKKFLSQYPGDTRATQPVLIFSHKPLNHFDEVTDICKVIDVAVVPDRPDVCVAITETYHDVASYHMLHAERQTDGSFALAANSLEGRVLPTGTNSITTTIAANLLYYYHYDNHTFKVHYYHYYYHHYYHLLLLLLLLLILPIVPSPPLPLSYLICTSRASLLRRTGSALGVLPSRRVRSKCRDRGS